MPDRFDGITRIQYDNDRNLNRLLKSMHEKYGENVPVEFWSLEDKAWYGQLEEMYLGAHDHYYILPGEDDLPLEEAGQIALDAYAEAWGSDAIPADELELYPGFYRLGHSEPVYWSFYICEKDTYNVLWHVELDGKTGEPRGCPPGPPLRREDVGGRGRSRGHGGCFSVPATAPFSAA